MGNDPRCLVQGDAEGGAVAQNSLEAVLLSLAVGKGGTLVPETKPVGLLPKPGTDQLVVFGQGEVFRRAGPNQLDRHAAAGVRSNDNGGLALQLANHLLGRSLLSAGGHQHDGTGEVRRDRCCQQHELEAGLFGQRGPDPFEGVAELENREGRYAWVHSDILSRRPHTG